MNRRRATIKSIQICVCCALFANIIKDVLSVRSLIAYPVGLFIGLLVGYWLPPVIRPPEARVGFVAWVGFALAASIGYWLIRSFIASFWGV